ncbi:SDR family oxidoreductase [Cyclobacterium marinum]|uniref:NAD-dependent epimerase/dehydratase n=1 Tax=Cyclobacterium marinum (strain ATCC 25205 / DSM 745 / LMG 13164 / NCIMB 1802) TaxID=880070 RepID=G0J660_CYCMS|nr:SDR family oxidoreductase [Cyclobacterium marinum]AEL26812.1 NAD-dependent epimerase/dehydratase [Cyclobacterium marinum DSM 745]
MKFEVKNNKVLVTGGAGFIGSNLIDILLENGNSVVCLDNFSTGNIQNLELAQSNANFTLIEGDIRDKDTCIQAVEGCDYVFHQAALGSVPRSIADPITSTAVNIMGFVNLLFAAKEAGVKRFIYAASSSTYGDHKALPKVEHVIGNALSPYAITKYVDELFAKNFSDIYGIETVGLRYFNVFGKRQDPNGGYAAVIPKFVSSLIKHQSPYINGDGTNSRDFTYIDNVIQANLLAAAVPSAIFKERMKEYQANTAGVPGINEGATISEVFNVAYGERTSLNELAAAIKEGLSNYDPAIAAISFQYGPNRPGDVAHSMASIDKGKTILGYVPQYSFQTGLKEACAWYWENLK